MANAMGSPGGGAGELPGEVADVGAQRHPAPGPRLLRRRQRGAARPAGPPAGRRCRLRPARPGGKGRRDLRAAAGCAIGAMTAGARWRRRGPGRGEASPYPHPPGRLRALNKYTGPSPSTSRGTPCSDQYLPAGGGGPARTGRESSIVIAPGELPHGQRPHWPRRRAWPCSPPGAPATARRRGRAPPAPRAPARPRRQQRRPHPGRGAPAARRGPRPRRRAVTPASCRWPSPA